MVTPEPVLWDNWTGIGWPQRGPWQCNIIAPNKAPEHAVSRSVVLVFLRGWTQESSRQRHVVDDLVNVYMDLMFCHLFICYLIRTPFSPQWLIWPKFVLWVAMTTLNLIGCLAWWKDILEPERKTWVPHARVTITFFFVYGQSKGLLVFNTNGYFCWYLVFWPKYH